ncbi:hypothetical protein JXA32_13640 [Candidatus Sumerlaeota bacterium]|nr:hypothetical protein [Candidatus Sumerlaeota bacterium]
MKNLIMIMFFLSMNINLLYSIDKTDSSSVERYIQELRNDEIFGNAHKYAAEIKKLLKENPNYYRSQVESFLSINDYQARQYLTEVLVCYYIDNGISSEEWPRSVVHNLIEGLRHEGFYIGLGNAKFSHSILVK